MTKPVFDPQKLLPGAEAAPGITAEQMSRFLHCHIAATSAKKIAAILNDAFIYDNALSVTYVPPTPKRLPIERKVRPLDVRVGDILMYCGVDKDHNSWPQLGSLITVSSVDCNGDVAYACVTKDGTEVPRQHAPAHCLKQGFSFVRRPFKRGEVVAYADQSKAYPGWEGNLLVTDDEASKPEGFGVWVIRPDGVTGSIDKSRLKRVV